MSIRAVRQTPYKKYNGTAPNERTDTVIPYRIAHVYVLELGLDFWPCTYIPFFLPLLSPFLPSIVPPSPPLSLLLTFLPLSAQAGGCTGVPGHCEGSTGRSARLLLLPHLQTLNSAAAGWKGTEVRDEG